MRRTATPRQHANDPDALTTDEIFQLCNQGAIRNKLNCCKRPTLATACEAAFNCKKSVLRKPLREQKLARKAVSFYVYGHTHQLETPWSTKVSDNRFISVASTLCRACAQYARRPECVWSKNGCSNLVAALL